MIDKRKTLKPKCKPGKRLRLKNLFAVSVCVMAAMLYMTAVSVWAETTSGSCGDDAKWELSDDGVLTISGTGEISNGGWDSDSVIEVDIGDGITDIGYAAFEDHYALTKVTFPLTLEGIGGFAFSQCENLTSADLTDTNVTTIDYYAFHSTGITSFYFPSTLTDIYEGAFQSCNSLTSADLSNTQIQYLYSEVFSSCEALESVILPDTLKMICECAFNYCESLKSIVIPDSVTEICGYAFEECTSLTLVDLGSVKEIDEYAFINCTALESITIPATVTEMGGAFKGCVSLVNITVEPGNEYFYIDDSGALMYKNTYGYEMIIFYPANITDTTYTIGADVVRVARGAFAANTYLAAFEVEEGNEALTAVDGVLLSIDEDEGRPDYDGPYYTILCYPAGKTSTSYDIPAGVTEIDDYTFMDNTYLKEVTFSSEIFSTIGYGAFYGCTNLESIEFPEGLNDIGDEAFYGCSSLKSITIPFYVFQVGVLAFGDCTSLTDVVFEEKIIDDENVNYYNFVLYSSAFANCTSLKNVTIHRYFWFQQDNIFFNCTSLEKVYCTPGSEAAELRYYKDYSPNVCLVYPDYNAVQNSDGVYFISGFSLGDEESLEDYTQAELYYGGDYTNAIDSSDTVYTGFEIGDVEFEAGEMGCDYIVGYNTTDDDDQSISTSEILDFKNYELIPVSITEADSEA
ncbi:MAG: leucine-rich repeat domain-containing protein [Clostridiales bacterium]|nr:leucine-rich repeat domain-containing protein [Clostridiales bacterium]